MCPEDCLPPDCISIDFGKILPTPWYMVLESHFALSEDVMLLKSFGGLLSFLTLTRIGT